MFMLPIHKSLLQWRHTEKIQDTLQLQSGVASKVANITVGSHSMMGSSSVGYRMVPVLVMSKPFAMWLTHKL